MRYQNPLEAQKRFLRPSRNMKRRGGGGEMILNSIVVLKPSRMRRRVNDSCRCVSYDRVLSYVVRADESPDVEK